MSPTIFIDSITFQILALTGGYHRLWSHRSYNASYPLQLFLAIVGAGIAERPIVWWARLHRAHHRYTDTDLDPYGAHRGLLWSHIGWLFFKPRFVGAVDLSDLKNNPIVQWQYRNYLWLSIVMTVGLPSLIAGWGWNDWVGGFVFAGATRAMIVQHVSLLCYLEYHSQLIYTAAGKFHYQQFGTLHGGYTIR